MDGETACAILAARFYHCLDRSDYQAVAALMAPDGVWHRHDGDATGPEGVRAALALRPATTVTRHLLANVVVDPDGDTAVIRYDLSVYSREGGAAARLAAILSGEDRVVRAAGGPRWLIQSKRAGPIFKFER